MSDKTREDSLNQNNAQAASGLSSLLSNFDEASFDEAWGAVDRAETASADANPSDHVNEEAVQGASPNALASTSFKALFAQTNAEPTPADSLSFDAEQTGSESALAGSLTSNTAFLTNLSLDDDATADTALNIDRLLSSDGTDSADAESSDADLSFRADSTPDLDVEVEDVSRSDLSYNEADIPIEVDFESEASIRLQPIQQLATDDGQTAANTAAANAPSSEAADSAKVALEKIHTEAAPEKDEVAAQAPSHSESCDEARVQDASDEEDDFPDGGGVVRLSVRAKMGKIYPDGEVVEGECTLGRDIYYDEADCRATEAPDEKERRYKRLLARMIIAIAIIGVAGIAGLLVHRVLQKSHSASFDVAQQFSFGLHGLDNGWTQIASSRDGKWAVMCGMNRGVVWRDSDLAASFFPPGSGCQGVRISDDGTNVWYANDEGQIFTMSLEKDFGFNGRTIARLPDMYDAGFSINSSNLTYLAYNGMDEPLSWVNQIIGSSQDTARRDLPLDALVCQGNRDDGIAYVTQSRLVILHADTTIEASLDTPKLSCPRSLAISCAYDGVEHWSVLCRDSLIQGRAAEVYAPIRHELPAIALGSEAASLMRHAEGSEVVTSGEWLRFSNDGSINRIPLSQTLPAPLSFVWRSLKTEPLTGLAGGRITRISSEGSVIMLSAARSQLVFTSFVSDASHAMSITHEGEVDALIHKSTFNLWDLANGSLTDSLALEGGVQSVNVSSTGHYGFVIIPNETASLAWMQWHPLKNTGTLPLRESISDAVWSPGDTHVLLQYEGGESELFERNDSGISAVRRYSAGQSVAFQSSDYLWLLEKGKVRLERIADGARSVALSKLSRLISRVRAEHVSAHGTTGYAVFWGQDGLWVYEAEKERITRLFDAPVTWVSFDASGELVATNLGIATLHSKDVRLSTHPSDIGRLYWTGDSRFLQTNDASQFFSSVSETSILPPARSYGVSFVGEAGGVHPGASRTLSLRGNVITLEDVSTEDPMIWGAMSGTGTQSWCWMTPQGRVQGRGGACVSLHQGTSRESAVPETDPEVASSMAYVARSTPRKSKSHRQESIKFIDSVAFSVSTTPPQARLFFAVSQGDLPKALTEGGIMLSPLQATLPRDERWYAVVISAPAHEPRTIAFQLDEANMAFDVRLLPSEYAGIGVQLRTSAETGSLSDDASVALRLALGQNRPALAACLSQLGQPTRRLALEFDEMCDLTIQEITSDGACLAEIEETLSKALDCATQPSLRELAFETIDIVFP
ncbi:MAG: hypothetical protein FWC40_03640 [Proteobacteria bacterium]|nr:hypothetical protein [Pseudomonadota bacterium]